jgi:voltage-gated potassium channel
MRNSVRIFIIISCLITTLLAFGTIGYCLIEEQWSIIDAFYMTVITIATVGFGEIHPLSSNGRLFTILLIFMGILAISTISAYLAKMLIDSQIKNIFGRGKMFKEIKKLRNHYIVCGFGRIGSTICKELIQHKIPFVVIEKDDHLANEAEKNGYFVLKNDATTDEVLKEAGIENAAGIVAALNSDAHNLFISLAARELNRNIRIIARGEEPGIEDRMIRAGADVVVSPLKLGGKQIAKMITENLKPSEKPSDDLSEAYLLQQISCTENTSKTIDDIVKEVQGLLAVALLRADGTTEISPGPNVVPGQNDLLLICRPNRHCASSHL